jgi:asparagine synthase (glutamine-hydrolysing)
MMSGFYGDDLYAGEHYWLADMLVEGRFRQAAALLRRRVGQIVPRRDLWDYGIRAVVPQSIKQVYRSVRPAVPKWARLIHPELAARSGLLENRQDPASFSAPGRQKRFRSLFYSAYAESITVMQEIAWQSGMQYVFPFMDRRIVEFVLQVPTELVGLPGDSRRILRDAMGDGLPDAVRQRQDKTGLFELFDKGIFEVGFADIRKLFNQPQVVKRGYVQEEWLRNEFSKRPGEQDGLRLWITLSLETWLQKYW